MEMISRTDRKNSKKKNPLIEWGIPIICAVVLGLLIKKFIMFPVYIPSSSMEPTLNVGDRLIVTRVYNPEHLERNDIVVFDSDELGKTLIKRLIGLPGDKISIEDGIVYVNGEKINQDYVEYPQSTYQEFVVPEGKYFFMGDNRDNSYDSRYWKNPYISADKILGKAQFRVYPFSQIGFLKDNN